MNTVYLTIPNVITIARLVAIPFVVWAMLSGEWMTAFVLFVLAGVSDAVDGFIARHYDQGSQLGRLLDPLADKALTIAVYTVFAVAGTVPVWLIVLIVLRDVAILAGAGLMAAQGETAAIRPVMASKINTTVLIVLAAWLLGAAAFGWSLPELKNGLIGLVALLTAVSATAYSRKLLARETGRYTERMD